VILFHSSQRLSHCHQFFTELQPLRASSWLLHLPYLYVGANLSQGVQTVSEDCPIEYPIGWARLIHVSRQAQSFALSLQRVIVVMRLDLGKLDRHDVS